MGTTNTNRSFGLRRSTLAAALAIGLGFTGVSFAQSTTGAIFGQAPAAAGETITVSSNGGVSRQVPVDASGRYRIGNLPLGAYTVTLQKDGNTVDSRKDVNITVNGGTEVSFAAAAGAGEAASLDAVTVTANSLPAIDVSSVDSRTVVTSQELSRLPLGRNAEAIALLAPGVVAGSGYFDRAVSFGGSSVTENAYYINGYNTTDPLRSIGGISLPYGAIDQQEIYTGGYSAMYGRSDGGVISQVGKRGTNDWHFGAQVQWAPKFASESSKNVYYPNGALPAGFGYTDESVPGTKYRSRDGNTKWTTTYDAYVGGPLIKDKLFFFIAAEAEKQEGKSTSSVASAVPANTQYTYNIPKYYAKLDWNINDSNILEFTAISNKTEYSGTLYDYDYATGKEGGFAGYDTSTKKGADIYIGKYTSYITDDLTFTATAGKNKTVDYGVTPGISTTLPYLTGTTVQDPAITGGTPIRNGVPTDLATDPEAGSKTHGLRLDLEYQLGNHHLAVGIDNMTYAAHNEGQAEGGPGYRWRYFKASDPTDEIDPGLGVGAPGGNGYYAAQYKFITTTSMSVKQKAQYIEDRWQVNDQWLISLGLRNDQFKNINDAGKAYVDQKNQWAPRLGVAWDVFGDSTFKVYGNLGRYYLALPNSVAIRGASASTYTNEYFTYTGINPATGEPTGLTPMGPGPVSSNGEYGVTPDAKTIAADNLKSQYQDEAILGFSKTLGPNWITGAKLTVRKLQAAIDDECDFQSVIDKAVASGINPDTVNLPHSCLIFNPGKTNTFLLANTDGSGYSKVTMTTADWGFKEGAKRKYYGLDLFLEHPFDGKWQARLDYTFSRSYGNTEGQVRSDIGQNDVSKTVDWDFAALMENSNGLLSNDRKHQIKAYGSYQFTPEWMVSGAVRINSGAPKTCLGYYGTDESDPASYGSYYHFCAGQASAPGAAGRQPWTKNLDLGVTYSPAFADHKLAFNFSIFNVLNDRQPLTTDTVYEDSPHTVSNTYNIPLYYTAPRYARLSATYDF